MQNALRHDASFHSSKVYTYVKAAIKKVLSTVTSFCGIQHSVRNGKFFNVTFFCHAGILAYS